MSVCAVFTKGGELHPKPTLPPRLFPIAFRVTQTHAHTHTHTHTHPQGTDVDKRAQVLLCRFDGCACKSGTGNIRKIKLRGAS